MGATKGGGNGVTPGMLLEVGVLLRALTVLLPISSPRTTLLNISSIFNCRLLVGICCLPFLSCMSVGALVVVEEVGRGRGVARVDGPVNPPAPPSAVAAAAAP